jgi:flagellar hook-associated protein 2
MPHGLPETGRDIMSGLMSIGGLASGLQTDSILASLEQIARAPITRMKQRQTQLLSRSQAWNTANTRLLAIKERAAALADLRSQMTISASSSTSTVAVSANSSAVAGNYTFTVNSLATYHQLTSQEFNDEDVTSVGSGDFSITVGDETTTIDASGMTLTELRDAINDSEAAAKAFIVSDGAATPKYRLVLTAQEEGTAGEMTIASTLTGGTAPTMATLVAASDTQLTFGTGANAFTVTRTGKTLTDVIPGVTINLTDDALGNTATVTVTSSTDGIKSAIQEFVTQYNNYIDFVAQQFSYNEETNATGALFGESRLQQVISDMYSALMNPVSNLTGSITSAIHIGLSTGTGGKLTIDTAELDAALADNLDGVFKLFENSGTATHSAVSYIASTTDTAASDATGYAVNITQAARQAQLIFDTSGVGLPETLGQDETLTINDETIALTMGMTRAQVVEAINAKASVTNVVASLTDATGSGTGNYLSLKHTEYGPDYSIVVSSDVAAGATSTGIGTSQRSEMLPGTGNAGLIGLNVLGTINGESASGDGQLLTSTTGDAEGLKIRITATAPGDYGTVVFTRAIGSTLESMMTSFTETDGLVENATESLQEQIDAIDEDIQRVEESVAREIARMRAQFNAMEVTMGRLQSQASQLSGLIAQFGTSSSTSS